MSGFVATLNDEIRRIQLASLNAVAFSLVPPAPDQCGKNLAQQKLKSKPNARFSASSDSPLSLNKQLIAIVSRDDLRHSSAIAEESSSQSSVSLSQVAEAFLNVGRGS